MKELLERLSSYNIFNYLFPGVLFAAFGEVVSSFSLLREDLVIGVFVYYFYGLVISRVGSLFLEPLFKWAKLVRFAAYSDFVTASKLDPKIEILSEMNNMYRTLSAVFLCLLFLPIVEHFKSNYQIVSDFSPLITIFFLMLLFIFSYQKQTDYITSRIKQANTPQGKQPHNPAGGAE